VGIGGSLPCPFIMAGIRGYRPASGPPTPDFRFDIRLGELGLWKKVETVAVIQSFLLSCFSSFTVSAPM